MNSELLKNIETGVFRVTKNKDSRSEIWNIFSQIEKDDGTTIDGVVICDKCNNILKYNGKQTSNLIRHKCYVLQNCNVAVKKVSNVDKENFLVSCSEWVVEDCRPFSIVDGDDFKKLVQSILSIGTKYGNNLDVSDMVPDSRTISRRVNEIAENKRLTMKQELIMAATSGTACITTDLWTDNFVKRNFLCATFNFLKDLKLKEIV